MPDAAAKTSSTDRRTFEDVACLGCGSLCDDLTVIVDSGRATVADPACERGRLQLETPLDDGPIACVEGEVVDAESAIRRAAELLRAARAPVVAGLLDIAIEDQSAAIAVAERVGAYLAVGHEAERSAAIQAFQRVGRVTATLGEVRARADVIVFWGTDPAVTHPRHFERYSIDAVGRFIPEGRKGRTVVVADSLKTSTMFRADCGLVVDAARGGDALDLLRLLVAGRVVADSEIEAIGIGPGPLRAAADAMRRACYGAFFFGSSFGDRGYSAADYEAIFRLTRELNRSTRFVALPIGGADNAAGAEAVCAWQTGYPAAVDFATGAPRFAMGDRTASERCRSRAADLVVLVGGGADGVDAGIPGIAIGPGVTLNPNRYAVALAAGRPGIEYGGTVVLSDGPTLPLRALLPTERPTPREWLRKILDALDGGPA